MVVLLRPACRVASATLARSTAPSMLLLPVAHTTRQYLATAVCSGGLALCAQGALVLAFRRSSNRILQRSAGFTAHHIVALCFMIVASAVGFAGWFSPSAATASAAARVLVADGTARWLSAMLLGELLLWDFPCSVFIPKLQVPVIIGHHIGLLATAALACVAPLYWGTFYLGWAELSNIPLQLIDTLEHAQGVAAEVDAPAATARRLRAWRDAIWPFFCASFLLVRVIGFTAVTARGLYPDILSALPAAGALRRPLLGFLGLGTAFNALMLFWFAEAAGKALGIVTWDSGVSSGSTKTQ